MAISIAATQLGLHVASWQAQVLTQRHKPPSILVEPMLVIEAMCVLCTHDSILHAVAHILGPGAKCNWLRTT